MTNRFRRLRKSEAMRGLVCETKLDPNTLVQPFFVLDGKNIQEDISAMPGIKRYSTDLLLKELEHFQKVGGRAGLFFGVPRKSQKSTDGKFSYQSNGIIQKAVSIIKNEFPDFLVITDVCLCSYMTHGHCGIVKDGQVQNDQTIEALGKVAVSHARAGADMVAPSDMMDFRVKRIRENLDQGGFTDIPIMSYAVKYASAFYGPFREVADSAPQFGDRKSYQMDPANKMEALKEAQQDVEEGADIVMVKPALAYLDIISLLKRNLTVPIAAYSVSGEYSMIKAAAQNKWISEKDIVSESLIAIKRAGADIIISYHAHEFLKWQKSN